MDGHCLSWFQYFNHACRNHTGPWAPRSRMPYRFHFFLFPSRDGDWDLVVISAYLLSYLHPPTHFFLAGGSNTPPHMILAGSSGYAWLRRWDFLSLLHFTASSILAAERCHGEHAQNLSQALHLRSLSMTNMRAHTCNPSRQRVA